MKHCSTSLIPLFFLLVHNGCLKTPNTFIYKEYIGPLRYGQHKTQFSTLLSEQPMIGISEKSDKDGKFYQEYRYEQLGLIVGLVSESEDSEQSISYILMFGRCNYTTSKGIHIGSTEEEVIAAYETEIDPKIIEKGQGIIIGSKSFGLYFNIDSGRVTSIMFGRLHS